MAEAAPDPSSSSSSPSDVPSLDEGPDFSLLPDVMWVQVMRYLSLADRSRLAQTCAALNDTFSHPSLWYSVHIELLGSIDRYSQSNAIFPDRYRHMVERFGAYFQDLTLSIQFFFAKLPKECIAVLDAMSSNCRLKTLTLSCGAIVSKQDLHSNKFRKADLEMLANIVARAFRMNTFILKSWPMYANVQTVNILDVLCNNEKIEDLETLSLFWQSASESTWATLNAQLPPPTSMLKTAFHFRNLKSLSLRSTMLSDAVMKELASSKRAPLKNLGILLTYSRSEKNGGVPDISSEAWRKLVANNPGIGVDVTIVTRMPYIDLHGFLQPEVPLTALSFMKYSQCTKEDLRTVTDKYKHCLTKFVDYSDGAEGDNYLVNLVTQSKELKYILHNGKIHYETVICLAGIRKGDWQYFQINFDNVSTHDRTLDIDDDKVLLREDSGEVRYAQGYGEMDEVTKTAVLSQMVKEVGQAIGRKWYPMNRKIIEEGHDETDIGIVPLKVAQATLSD